ncbi:MAG: hypothetical protein HXL65_00005 [Streptococcus sp.]|nr:hypothetical protein [Streptococcus sp.]
MQGKNKLFGASFEQSKRIVKNDILTEEGTQIGSFSSMSFWNRASLLLVLFTNIITYGVGINFPDSLRDAPESIQVVSESTGAQIGEVGFYLRPIILGAIILFTVLVVFNIFPKINYAHQLLYGTILMISFIFLVAVATLPLTAGLTIGAFGIVAFVVQLIFSGYLVEILIIDVMKEVKTSLYNETEIKDKDWGTPIIHFVKRYGGILVGLSILNRWTFNFGEFSKSNPGLMSFLFGWLFIGFTSLLLLAEGQLLKCLVKAFYFFKYRKEYREYFNITNEQWYGKFRARFMSKQK